jgi:hypothetical protein
VTRQYSNNLGNPCCLSLQSGVHFCYCQWIRSALDRTVTKGLVSRDLISSNRPVLCPVHFCFNKRNRNVDSDSRAASEYLKGSKSDDDSRLLRYDVMCRRIGGASHLRLLPSLLYLVTRSISFSPVFFLRFVSSTIRILQNYCPFEGPIPLLPPAVFPLKPVLSPSSHIPFRPFHLSHILNISFCHLFIFLPSSLTSFGPCSLSLFFHFPSKY